MSYKLSAKNRKFKAKIIKLLRALKFKWLNSSLGFKLLIIWNIILISSLFLTWLYNWVDSYNAFSSLTGYVGYIIILNSILNLFLLISTSNKEKLKLNSPIKINELNIFLTGAIFCLLIIFMVFSFIKGLFVFSESIIFWKWIIIGFLWAIVNLLWSLVMIREYKYSKEDILFSNETTNISDINNWIVDKNNMKLPF